MLRKVHPVVAALFKFFRQPRCARDYTDRICRAL